MPVSSTDDSGVRMLLPFHEAAPVRAAFAPIGTRKPPSWMARPLTPIASVPFEHLSADRAADHLALQVVAGDQPERLERLE